MYGPLVVRALLIVGLIVTAQALAPEVVWDLTREDGVVETATIFVWLIAAVIFVDVSLRGRARGAWILAALSTFIAMEEMSWGQRFFDVDAPHALEFVNRQGEINVHNTEILHHLMRPLSLVVAGVLVVGLPALTRQRWKIASLVRRLDLPHCPTRLGWAWLSATILTLSPILVRGTYYGPFDEVGELIMAGQFLVFAAALVYPRRSDVGQI
jgi:hypothetical protein